MKLESFAYKGNLAGLQDFFVRAQASNSSLRDEPGSRCGWIMDKVRAARPDRVLRILEIGCQTGGITKYLLEVTPQVMCVDIVRNQLDMVAAMGANTILCFAEELHTRRIGRFDVVVMTEVLNHAVDAELATANAWGKVGPGGHLIVTVPHGDRWSGSCISNRFDSDHDLTQILSAGTGMRKIAVEHIMQDGDLIFYACDVCKPLVSQS